MNRAQKIAIFGLGLLSVGVLFLMKRRSLSPLAQSAINNAGLFGLAIPSEAAPYAATILAVSEETGVDPFLITAVLMRESRAGLALDAEGRGDNGHGHGLMQIDDRTWGSWLVANDWLDPYTNIKKGAEILASNLSYFEGRGLVEPELTRAAAAGYNAGPGRVWSWIQDSGNPDAGTAGHDYGASVLAMAQGYEGGFGVA